MGGAYRRHVQPGRPLGSALLELAAVFLRLGATAFGGPAAHIAVMEDELVRRRRWLTQERFLDILGATNLIPGPNSTEVAIHVGYLRGGLAGLVVAGTAFILPAMFLAILLARAYVAYGTLPQASAFLSGAKPAIVVVIAQALWRLGLTAIRSRQLAIVGLIALLAAALGTNELVLLFTAGAMTASLAMLGAARGPARFGVAIVPIAVAAATTPAVPFTQSALFLFFLKVGSVLFGSGYVLIAFLRADLVERWHWLTNAQLLDAIAVGQLTPGPVSTAATFIGYVLGRETGALLATVGIFLPAFVFVALSAPFLSRLRRSWAAAAFLDGLNVAALALLAVVTWQLTRAAIVDWRAALIAALGAVALLRFGVNSAWLVIGGGLAGLALG